MNKAFFAAPAVAGFAANSLLCRAALRGGRIDPYTFTTIRLAAGAATVWIIIIMTGSRDRRHPRTMRLQSGVSLFVYAGAFSFAYTSLPAATGTLILFGSVQMTVFGISMFHGARPRRVEWAGLAVSVAGLLYLTIPAIERPEPVAAAAMVLSGAAWGLYTLAGRGSKNAIADSGSNLFHATIPATFLSLLMWKQTAVEPAGVVLAVASGSLSTGIGYCLWYTALPFLTAAQSGILQLMTPVLAATGAALFLGERLTLHLAISAVLIVVGVGMTVLKINPGRQGS